MIDVKYVTYNQLKKLVQEATILVGDAGYCSLRCLNDIYYSTEVFLILCTGEHERYSNYNEYYMHSLQNFKTWSTLFNSD